MFLMKVVIALDGCCIDRRGEGAPRKKSGLQNIEYEPSFECDDIEAMRRHLLGLGHSLIHEIREEP